MAISFGTVETLCQLRSDQREEKSKSIRDNVPEIDPQLTCSRLFVEEIQLPEVGFAETMPFNFPEPDFWGIESGIGN